MDSMKRTGHITSNNDDHQTSSPRQPVAFFFFFFFFFFFQGSLVPKNRAQEEPKKFMHLTRRLPCYFPSNTMTSLSGPNRKSP
jgi:hypothetical protein